MQGPFVLGTASIKSRQKKNPCSEKFILKIDKKIKAAENSKDIPLYLWGMEAGMSKKELGGYLGVCEKNKERKKEY